MSRSKINTPTTGFNVAVIGGLRDRAARACTEEDTRAGRDTPEPQRSTQQGAQLTKVDTRIYDFGLQQYSQACAGRTSPPQMELDRL
jgi:hypothetical protein